LFDFPNTPSVGDRVTGAGGIVYAWDGVKWTSNVGAVTAPVPGDVGRNLIHNSMFNVAQRGVGPWTTGSQYTVDRWSALVALDTTSFMQQAFPDVGRAQVGDEAAVYYLDNTFTGNAAAGAQNYLIQRIENVRRLAGKTVTVSFWVYGTTKLGINLVQLFGTGGSPSAPLWVNATGASVTATTTWTRYSATFTVPSAAGKTLGTNNDSSTGLVFFYSAGATANAVAGNIGVQSGYINLWGVQLEIGSVATPLEKPDPQVDLANCQRFYQAGGNARITAYQTAGSGCAMTQSLPVSMRATPTVSTQNFVSSNISSASFTALDPATVQIFTGVFTTTGIGYVQMNFTASADL
jgi:hypothetical protein